MKKLLSFLAVTLSLAVVFTVATPNTAAANGASIGTFCAANNNLGLATTGECASFIGTNGTAFCRLEVGGTEVWVLLGFKNRGACISEIQQLNREFLKSLP